ncbi:hypothetical protein KIN20_006265 [Parelaphostrongylus tenuis]|uniref:Uncharacterized protein n=1 Tax=Parelaphostrongylus tenuis TaxID=148309 RepID=A0AAD5QI62_PARTN|nr:hypothetical protein KIN20_006265 [Parelaphostrongylus tenuis]
MQLGLRASTTCITTTRPRHGVFHTEIKLSSFMMSFIQHRVSSPPPDDSLEMIIGDDERIRRLDVGEMPWLAQFTNFCMKNEPCVLTASFTSDWPARNLWVKEDGTPNLDYLRKEYGEDKLKIIQFHEFAALASCNLSI